MRYIKFSERTELKDYKDTGCHNKSACAKNNAHKCKLNRAFNKYHGVLLRLKNKFYAQTISLLFSVSWQTE